MNLILSFFLSFVIILELCPFLIFLFFDLFDQTPHTIQQRFSLLTVIFHNPDDICTWFFFCILLAQCLSLFCICSFFDANMMFVFLINIDNHDREYHISFAFCVEVFFRSFFSTSGDHIWIKSNVLNILYLRWRSNMKSIERWRKGKAKIDGISSRIMKRSLDWLWSFCSRSMKRIFHSYQCANILNSS